MEEQVFKSSYVLPVNYICSHFNPCIFHRDGADSFGLLVFWLISPNWANPMYLLYFSLLLFLAWSTYSIIFLSMGLKGLPPCSTSLWWSWNLVGLPGSQGAFVQNCSVCLRDSQAQIWLFSEPHYMSLWLE